MSEERRVRGAAETGDAVTRYLETFERLRTTKRWSTQTVTFRFVALALGAAGASVTYDRLEAAGDVLRRKARRTSPLRSDIRYVVAAMILRRGLEPGAVHGSSREARELFRVHGLPRRGIGPTLAALLLALLAGGRTVPASQVERLARIYESWSGAHAWLTSARDLPAAALHAATDRHVHFLTADVERAYDRLRRSGFRAGHPLQIVSHLLVVDPRGTDTAVQRFEHIAARLGAEGEHVRPGRYDEVATLALTREDPAGVVGRTLRYRDRLRAERPRPTREVAFSLAAGVVLAEDAEHAAGRSAGDLAALQSIRAILDAQQAVMVAAISSGAVAAAGAGSN